MTELHDQSRSAHGVYRFGLALLLVSCAIAVTYDAWADMFQTGLEDSESGYILLVPLVFLWLVWVRRERFTEASIHGQWVGTFFALTGWMCWLYGVNTSKHTPWELGAILLALGALFTVYGTRCLVKLLPAHGMLLFMIPLWPERRQQIAWPLQLLTARTTQIICDILHMGIDRDNNLLSLNGVDIVVAEACNGMRMVISLLLVAYAYAFLAPLRFYIRVTILIMSPLVAVLCNVMRLVPTVWVYGHASPTFAEHFHDVTGWVMLGLALTLIAGTVGVIRWIGLPVDQSSRAALPPAQREARFTWKPTILSAGVFAIVLGGAGISRKNFARPSDTATYHERVRLAAAALPIHFNGWTGRDLPVPADAVQSLRPNVLISRQYASKLTGRQFSLLVVQCADARTLTNHYPPVCYGNQRFSLVTSQPQEWNIDDRRIQGAEFEFEPTSFDRLSLIVSYYTLMPDGTTAPDMAPVFAATGDLRHRFYGAAEVQWVFPSGIDSVERYHTIEEFSRMLRPLTDAISSGESR